MSRGRRPSHVLALEQSEGAPVAHGQLRPKPLFVLIERVLIVERVLIERVLRGGVLRVHVLRGSVLRGIAQPDLARTESFQRERRRVPLAVKHRTAASTEEAQTSGRASTS